ncbi:hypothetical protein J4402_02625 [Candidatus Pacearchaeota archaeon]|nr:hypothetical protein [Candidatus Pacearchaeota archaeon]
MAIPILTRELGIGRVYASTSNGEELNAPVIRYLTGPTVLVYDKFETRKQAVEIKAENLRKKGNGLEKINACVVDFEEKRQLIPYPLWAVPLEYVEIDPILAETIIKAQNPK